MGLKKGFFVTFEGIEGSGKTTQIKLLENYIKKNITKKVFLTREPGGTKVSEKLRKIIINDLNEKSNPYSELFLIFAARAEHYELIKKKIHLGFVVLCDRYVDSTIAYQHYNGSIPIKTINNLQRMIDNKIAPNLTFLLNLDVKKSKHRMKSRNKKLDRFDKYSINKMKKIGDAFLKIYKKNKKRIILVNNNLTINDSHLIIVKHFLKKIKK